MQSNVLGKKTVKEWIFTTNCRITDAAELKFSPIEVFSKGIEVGNFAYENNLFPEHLLVYVFFFVIWYNAYQAYVLYVFFWYVKQVFAAYQPLFLANAFCVNKDNKNNSRNQLSSSWQHLHVKNVCGRVLHSVKLLPPVYGSTIYTTSPKTFS